MDSTPAPTADSRTAALRIAELVKHYGSTRAVDGVSLEVGRGRLFGFLGPNGAGKTTTIGCLTGLLRPTRGSVELLGEPLTEGAHALRRRIGVMPEDLALFDDLYVQEFLAFSGRVFGLDARSTRERGEELIEALGLAESRRKRLGDFSSGMRKKVAFAAAVLHRPEILFLDEPFESLDPGTVAMLKEWLLQFVAGGGTVFMTSHVLERVERLCTHAAIIRAGRIVWDGDLTAPARGDKLTAAGQVYDSLEGLFVALVGREHHSLAWL